MKKLFRKAVTVLGSAVLIGATVGIAAAASYPTPFTSNTAIVVGANAAPSDNIAAASIASNLDANAATTDGATTITTNGDSYKFEKTSTKLHLGDDITSIKSSLDGDQMPGLLGDGTYTDDNNDEFDYTQKVTMHSNNLSMFDDNDYKADTPTVGIKIPSGAPILTYELDFNDQPEVNNTPTTDLTLMGKDYYVLAATATKLTLLDSAASAIVAEGESTTISAGGKTYTVSIEFVDADSAKLNVNGEITNDISTTKTYKLDDGSYLGMKEILYSQKDSGISKVEFSIGSGKLVLDNGNDIRMNENTITGLTSNITVSGSKYSKISIDWNADDKVFVAKDAVATMPGFKTLALSFTGLNYPTEEPIEVSYDGDENLVLNNFPLKDSTEDIELLYNAGGTAFTTIGKDANSRLVTGYDSIIFDRDTDAYFVASWTDGKDAESYLMRATNFKTDNVDKVTFQYKKGGSWSDAKVDRQSGDTFSIGSVDLVISDVNNTLNTVNVTRGNSNTHFNTLYSAAGMKVFLPVNSTTAGDGVINLSAAPADYKVQMVEENVDGDQGGNQINITAAIDTSKRVSVNTVDGDGTASKIGNSDIYRSFVSGPLATEVLKDTSGDVNSVKLIYHGNEVTADVYLTSADAIASTSGDAGVMTVKDSEVASVAGKNLVVVGGSAINSVAADLLGGAYSGAAFTSATGVSAGGFLIQSFDRAGKTAMLVAGYNAADTEKAVTYLLNNDVDTTVGMKMKGTSATEATVVTA